MPNSLVASESPSLVTSAPSVLQASSARRSGYGSEFFRIESMANCLVIASQIGPPDSIRADVCQRRLADISRRIRPFSSPITEVAMEAMHDRFTALFTEYFLSALSDVGKPRAHGDIKSERPASSRALKRICNVRLHQRHLIFKSGPHPFSGDCPSPSSNSISVHLS